MNGFKFDFSKISPQTPPPDFSRASPSVWASPSILGRFAPSILGRFAPSIRTSPLTFDWGPWFGPSKINSWIRPWLSYCLIITSWPIVYRQFYGRGIERHPSNSSSSSAFCSHSSWKFTFLPQTWLLQFTSLWHLTNKSQQTLSALQIHWHVSLQTSKHQHSKDYTRLSIKQIFDYKICLLTYKTLTNQQLLHGFGGNAAICENVCLYVTALKLFRVIK